MKGEFHLPLPNIFIAEDIAIKEEDIASSAYPVELIKDDLGELFYRKDTKFLQPRAYIQYHIRSPLPLQSVENSILMDLLANCLLQVFMSLDSLLNMF